MKLIEQIQVQEAKMAITMALSHIGAVLRITQEMCDEDLNEYLVAESQRILKEVAEMDDEDFIDFAERIKP